MNQPCVGDFRHREVKRLNLGQRFDVRQSNVRTFAQLDTRDGTQAISPDTGSQLFQLGCICLRDGFKSFEEISGFVCGRDLLCV